MSQYLEAVTVARENFRKLEDKLRAEFENTLQEKLGAAQNAIDIAAGMARQAGDSKAAIGRAMKTSNYNTYNDSIERGLAAIPAHETILDSENIITELDKSDFFAYDELEDVIHVTHMGDDAVFWYSRLEDGTLLLDTNTELWDTDYTKRNEAVALLDGVMDGALYHQIDKFLKGVGK